jgi:hypothetical protein
VPARRQAVAGGAQHGKYMYCEFCAVLLPFDAYYYLLLVPV